MLFPLQLLPLCTLPLSANLADCPLPGFEASCKTVFVMGLLKQLVAEGHRTLVFSQSRVM